MDPYDCGRFLYCNGGFGTVMGCHTGYHYSIKQNKCLDKDEVDCKIQLDGQRTPLYAIPIDHQFSHDVLGKTAT